MPFYQEDVQKDGLVNLETEAKNTFNEAESGRPSHAVE